MTGYIDGPLFRSQKLPTRAALRRRSTTNTDGEAKSWGRNRCMNSVEHAGLLTLVALAGSIGLAEPHNAKGTGQLKALLIRRTTPTRTAENG